MNNSGNFVTIIPRGVSAEDSRYEKFKMGESDTSSVGSHFTLVSNLRCGPNEVNVYETFAPFRSPDAILTSDGVNMLKILTKSKELKVNCVNVQLQEECECGAISLALAVQLCFFSGDEVYHKMKDVRRDLFRCFKDDQLNYFSSTKRTIRSDDRILFSLNV